ncbi:hypothetical protein [Cellulomonas sp. ICMP 17802]|uniref:hypothetical protein n=1 Tax=Cellulomonas sp. ICMP 17802 TaxID=3239199 RepID=UPI00351AC8E2
MNDSTEHEQPEGTDDVAFARLQAADPAAGSEPDLARLTAAITERTGVELGGPTDELAARRNRRAPRWLQIAAAVAGVAVIGGGSYAYGLNNAPETVTASPAMSLANSGGGRDAAAPESASMAAGGGVASDQSKLMYPWYGGRTVFTASGLSTEGGSGKAYGFDAAGTFSQETLVAAATALGVTGQPRQEYGSWSVGATDGTGPSVSLSPDGLASLSYYDPTRDPWNCSRSAEDSIQAPGTDSAGGGVAVPEPAGTPECTTAGAAPTGDAAVAQAADVLKSLGIDTSGYQLAATTDPGSPQVTNVTATQVVDGQQTGVTASVTIVADGVQSLYAPLAPIVDLGAYDVVSPTEAVARLGDPRFGISGGGGVMPLASEGMKVADDSAAIAPSDEPTVPATPTAGSPLAWPVQHVTLVSSRLGVALTTLPTGASVLVPTYELADADGMTWSVIAVVDDQLDFSAAG